MYKYNSTFTRCNVPSRKRSQILNTNSNYYKIEGKKAYSAI